MFLKLVVALALVVVMILEYDVELMLATTVAVAVESMEPIFSLGVVGVVKYTTDDD